MKAKPVKIIQGEGYVGCAMEEATHVTINIPGPSGILTLPVIIKGSRAGTNCWSWNGSTDKPTLKPSVLTKGLSNRFRCHSWINNGQAQFLSDCSHKHVGQTVDILEVE